MTPDDSAFDRPIDLFVAYNDELRWLKEQLAAGRTPSDLVMELRGRGLSPVLMIWLARQATGTTMGNMKALGEWWGPDGITDAAAFNRWFEKSRQR